MIVGTDKMMRLATKLLNIPVQAVVGITFFCLSLLGNVQPVHAQTFFEAFFSEIPTSKEMLLFPVAGDRAPKRIMRVIVTAYNSIPNQTDSTPFNTADGTLVRDGILAANFLPLGTRVKIPDIYGDKEFVVKDRMNPRYTKHVDIWMEELADARQFGRKNVRIEVY